MQGTVHISELSKLFEEGTDLIDGAVCRKNWSEKNRWETVRRVQVGGLWL